jgi:ribose transport system permease protein
MTAIAQAVANLGPIRRRVIYAYGAAIGIFLVGQILHPGFASGDSIRTILLVASFVGLVAAGQTLVILIGGIDLSVPWVLNGAAILLITTGLGQNGRLPEALALTLGMGLAVGFANGVGVAYVGVPAVVMTLGMNGIMQGLSLGLSQGLTCQACTSYAPPLLQHIELNTVLGIPEQVVLWIAVTLAVTVVLGATAFGRRTYAIGNNPTAAFLAGIRVKRVTVILYMLSGFFSALAGIMLVSYGGQASLGLGDPYLFQSIAAVVIGGASILGGRGTYLGSAAGAITLVALVTLLSAENIPEYGRSIVYGVTILVLLLLYGRERRH